MQSCLPVNIGSEIEMKINYLRQGKSIKITLVLQETNF